MATEIRVCSATSHLTSALNFSLNSIDSYLQEPNSVLFKVSKVALRSFVSMTVLPIVVLDGLIIIPFYGISAVCVLIALFFGFATDDLGVLALINGRLHGYLKSCSFTFFWNVSNLFYFNLTKDKLLESESFQRVLLDSFPDMGSFLNKLNESILIVTFLMALVAVITYSFKMIVPLLKVYDVLLKFNNLYFENFESFSKRHDIENAQEAINFNQLKIQDFGGHPELAAPNPKIIRKIALNFCIDRSKLDEETLELMETFSTKPIKVFTKARLIYLLSIGQFKNKTILSCIDEEAKTAILKFRRIYKDEDAKDLDKFFNSLSKFKDFKTLRGKNLEIFCAIKSATDLQSDEIFKTA